MINKLFPLSLLGLLIFTLGTVALLNYYFTNENLAKVPLRVDINMAFSRPLKLNLKTDGLASISSSKPEVNINTAGTLTQSAQLTLVVNQITSSQNQ